MVVAAVVVVGFVVVVVVAAAAAVVVVVAVVVAVVFVVSCYKRLILTFANPFKTNPEALPFEVFSRHQATLHLTLPCRSIRWSVCR